MADNNVVHIGANSPEQVAYKLAIDIAKAEGKYETYGVFSADRQYILDTYAEALKTVKGQRVLTK